MYLTTWGYALESQLTKADTIIQNMQDAILPCLDMCKNIGGRDYFNKERMD